MAINRLYSYTKSDGTTDSVVVSVDASGCRKAFPQPDPRSSGISDISTETLQISIANPIIKDLFVHFERVVTKDISGTEIVNTSNITIKIPRGETSITFTYNCNVVTFGSPSIITNTSYSFLDQPDTTVEEEIEDEVLPTDDGEIPYSNTPSYFFQFQKVCAEKETKVCTVQVYKKGDNNATREITVFQKEPVIIETKGGKDKTIVPTALTLKLLAFEENEFRDIFTSADADLKILYFEGDDLYFEGYNVAEFYETNLSQKINYVEATFACGLALLKDKPFSFSGTPRQKQIDVFWHILKGIGSKIPLMDKNYVYPANISYSIKNSPLQYVEVDTRSYFDDGEALSCYEVLEAMLKPYRCRLYASWGLNGNAAWFIEEINARLDYRLPWRFYRNGKDQPENYNFSDSGRIIDLFVNKRPKSAFTINRSRNQTSLRQIHSVEVVKELDKIPKLIPTLRESASIDQLPNWQIIGVDDYAQINFVEGFDGSFLGLFGKIDYANNLVIRENTTLANVEPVFDDTAYLESDESDIFAEDGNKLGLTINFACIIAQATQDKISDINTAVLDSFIGIQVKVTDSINTYYLTDEGFWQTSVAYIKVRAQYSVSPDINFFSLKLPQTTIPVDGTIKMLIHRPSAVSVGTPLLLVPQDTLWLVGDIIEEYQTSKGFALVKSTLNAKAAISNSAAQKVKVEVIHGDSDTLQNVSSLSVGNNLVSGWEKYRAYNKLNETLSLSQINAQSIIEDNYTASRWGFRDFEILENGVDLDGNAISFATCIGFRDLGSRRFIATSFKYSPNPRNDSNWGAKIISAWEEVTDAQPVINYYNDVESSKTKRSSNTSTTNISTTNQVENDYDITRDSVPKEVQAGISVYYNLLTGKLVIDQGDLPTIDQTEPDGNNYINSVAYSGNNIIFGRVGLEDLTLQVPDLQRVTNRNSRTSNNIEIEKFNSMGVGNLIEFYNNSGSSGYKLGGFSVENEGEVGGVYIKRADQSFRSNFQIDLRKGGAPIRLFEINYNTNIADHQYKLSSLGGVGNRLVFADSQGVLGNYRIGNGLEALSDQLRIDESIVASKSYVESKFNGTPNFIPVFGGNGLENSTLYKLNAYDLRLDYDRGQSTQPFTINVKDLVNPQVNNYKASYNAYGFSVFKSDGNKAFSIGLAERNFFPNTPTDEDLEIDGNLTIREYFLFENNDTEPSPSGYGVKLYGYQGQLKIVRPNGTRTTL